MSTTVAYGVERALYYYRYPPDPPTEPEPPPPPPIIVDELSNVFVIA